MPTRAIFTRNKIRAQNYEVFYVASKCIDTSIENNSNPQLNELRLPFVLIHGALVSHRYLMPTAQELAAHFDVYVLDLPGHGASTKPKKTLEVVEQAEVVAAWMDAVGLERAYILANSYGCEITVELALRHPHKTEKLVLTAPTADPSQPNLNAQLFRLFLDAFFEKPAMLLVLIRDLWDMSMRRATETSQIMIDYDYLPRLPLVKQKTLVVRGSNDTLAPQEWCEKVVSLLPDARLEVIDGGPHDINFSCGEKLAALANQFVHESAAT